MKRHIIIIVLIAVILPGALLAQDELTLESLQELITSLDERLSAIEEQVADPWSPDVIYTDEGVCQSPLHSDMYPYKGRIRQETADAFRTKFGVSIDPASVNLESISFSVGTSDVFLEFEKSGRIVVEKWANCEYLGHSEWSE